MCGGPRLGAEGGAGVLRNRGDRNGILSEPEPWGRTSVWATLPDTPCFLPSHAPPFWPAAPPGQRRSGAMGSAACLSVLLAMPSYAWRRGPRTPKTGGEWWGYACEGPGGQRRRAGPDPSHQLCFADGVPTIVLCP